MAGEHIVVGQDFTVTCDVTPTTNLSSMTGHLIFYRKPGGSWSSITPTNVNASSCVGAITSAINALSGLAGTWEFYVYAVSGALKFRSKIARLVVHPLGFGT